MESLLDVVLANSREEQINGAALCRLVLVCSLKSRQDSTDYAQGVFNAQCSLLSITNHEESLSVPFSYAALQESCTDVTGLMLVLPTCMAVMLEGEHHALQATTTTISKQEAAGTIRDTKVLLSMEGIPDRCSKSLLSAFIPSASSMEAADPADPKQIVRLSSGITSVLVAIASSLSTLSEYDTRRQLSSLATYYEDLPTPDVILALTASSELPRAREWLEMHTNARKQPFLLDDEVVWPMHWTIKV